MIRWTLSLAASLFLLPTPATAAENYLPPIGGSGGAQFISLCWAGQELSGFELRAGDDIDAIRPLCVSAYTTGSVTLPQLSNGSGLVQRYSSAAREVDAASYSPLAGDWFELPKGWHGGTGGRLASVVCPHARPIVVAMHVAAEGVRTVTVNNIHLYCGLAVPSQQLDENPSAIFDAPKASGSPAVLGIGGTSVSNSAGCQRCPEGKVAVGVHGRSGEWVDAIGLICDAPHLIKAMALGRVQSTTPPDPTKTICDYAKSARERNSPTAPSLEKRCAAQGGQPPPKALGRVARAEGAPNPNVGKSFCDMAASAREAQRPTAAALQQRCDAERAAHPAGADVPPPPAGADVPPPPAGADMPPPPADDAAPPAQ